MHVCINKIIAIIPESDAICYNSIENAYKPGETYIEGGSTW